MSGGVARLALVLALVSFAANPAFAHAHLKSASPGANATVHAAPKVVTLSFNEGVVAKFSGLELSDAAGKPVALGPAVAGAATLTAPITGDLAPGTYTVTWHAVATDSHRTKGSFRFTFAP